MIDAVRLCAFVDDPDRVARRLERARWTTDSDGLPVVTGYVGALRARLKGDRLILRGSLPTFVGVAFPLPRPAVERARRLIEDALGVDLGDARVWGLEFTADLALPHPAPIYLPLLARRPRFQRVEFEGETVSFRTATRWLSFYVKAAERRARGLPAPPGNVLRVELQYRKRLARQVGADGPVTFADLHAPAFWAHLVGLWLREVEAVERARAPLALDYGGEYQRALALAGLHVVGRPAVEAGVRAAFADGRFSRGTMYARLKWLRELAADSALTVRDGRAAELDAAIQAAADRALAEAGVTRAVARRAGGVGG